jgi:hypothetical protein
MLNAINNIYSINKLVEQSKDNQIIRATNTKLKTDDSIKTYFYVRNNKIDQIFQKLTDWTDGAKARQTLAKNQIITNLKIIKDNPEFDKKFPDKEKREKALVLMNKIIMTVNTTEKDITSSMIKKDLLSLNSFLSTYETIEKKSEHSDSVEDSSEGDVANSEAESDLNAAKANNTDSNITELAGIDIGEGITVVMHPSEIDNFENNIQANISKNMSSYLSKLANVTSVDVAEVVFNSEDPEVDGSPYKESNSQLAESTINNPMHALKNVPPVGTEKMSNSSLNAVEIPDIQLMRETLKVVNHSGSTDVAKAIKKYESKQADSPPMDAAEAATESTPSPASSAPSSKAETKSAATDNPYLESLNSKWSAKENGYFEVSKPFYITGAMPTSKILAQAYLLPEGKKLDFIGKKYVASNLNENQVVRGEHELREELDLSNQKRDLRTYLTLEVKLEMKSFKPSTKVAQNSAVLRLQEEYKNSLITTYKDSVEKISAEYKKTNPGKELETLVIAPITSTEGILLPTERTALVSAVKEIQLGNPGLKIAISADRETHSDAIRAAYET